MMLRMPQPVAIVCLALLGAVSATSAATAPASATSEHQQQVRSKGAEVMPFALDQTLHTFDKTATGGVQRVRVRSSDSAPQIQRIRMHLREIARSFAARDFSKPEHIHGAGMQGLAVLRDAARGELDIAYHELPDGAEIDYTAHTPRLVAAIHDWFDAQLSDHGRDASTSSAAVQLDAFAWLAGRWLLDDGKRRVEETWTAPAADMMLGMSRTVRGGETATFEFMRLELRADGVFYLAQPRGDPPVEFLLESWDGNTAVFVKRGNTGHLRRIVYRRGGGSTMTARVEGGSGDSAFSEDFPYHRDAPEKPAASGTPAHP